MSVPPVTGGGASTSQTNMAQDLSDRFLTMLTAQMRNQDPLNPLDNAELTSQLAQISTVTGISQLNTTMEWLGYSMSSLQSTQATSLIGRQVMVPGDSMTLKEGEEARGGYALSIPVASAEVIVKNEDGTEVARMPLSGTDIDAGTHTFVWDGKNAEGDDMPDGKYKFEVQVSDGAQVGVAPPLSISQIASVQPYAGGTLILDSEGKAISLADVHQVW